MKISPLASEIWRWSGGWLGGGRLSGPCCRCDRGTAGGSSRISTVPPSANPRLRSGANPAGLGVCAWSRPIHYPCSSMLLLTSTNRFSW